MWTPEQGQAIGRIMSEYRWNPANAKMELYSEVKEHPKRMLTLDVWLCRHDVQIVGDFYNIEKDGSWERI